MDALTALIVVQSLKESEIIERFFTNGKDKCCIIGHLQRLSSKDPNDYSYRNCVDSPYHPMREYSSSFLSKEKGVYDSIASINNYESTLYPQKTPKKRVVALLTDMIEAGY